MELEEEKKEPISGASRYKQMAANKRQEKSAAQIRDEMIRTNEETISMQHGTAQNLQC